jgi:hypothetical protein
VSLRLIFFAPPNIVSKANCRDGAFEKAVAIWTSMHGLSALMLSGQLGAVVKKSARAARLEQTVSELILADWGYRARTT